jgi:hypothetical protein
VTEGGRKSSGWLNVHPKGTVCKFLKEERRKGMKDERRIKERRGKMKERRKKGEVEKKKGAKENLLQEKGGEIGKLIVY